MAEPELKFYLSPEAKAAGIEFRAPRERDAGFDLVALRAVHLEPDELALVPTGLHLAIPPNWVGLVRDRSSVALRGGVTVAGVIDSAYRGEVKVAIYNHGREPLVINQGERIAQCVIVPHLTGEKLTESGSLDGLGVSERGASGFGSTGR